MNKLYDNGTLLLGNIDDIIKEFERQIKNDVFVDFEIKEILKDLYELKNMKHKYPVEIVMINYDNPMGYSIDYWDNYDVVKEVK